MACSVFFWSFYCTCAFLQDPTSAWTALAKDAKAIFEFPLLSLDAVTGEVTFNKSRLYKGTTLLSLTHIIKGSTEIFQWTPSVVESKGIPEADSNICCADDSPADIDGTAWKGVTSCTTQTNPVEQYNELKLRPFPSYVKVTVAEPVGRWWGAIGVIGGAKSLLFMMAGSITTVITEGARSSLKNAVAPG